jgi:alpha-glucuronidase
MKVKVCVFLMLLFGFNLQAEDGHNLWLRNKSIGQVNVVYSVKSASVAIAISELQQGWQGKDGVKVVLTIKPDKAVKGDGFKITPDGIQANTDLGILLNPDVIKWWKDKTQEYLGQSVHLVFLATMWEEFLKSDTYQQGIGSTVAHCTDGSIYAQKHTAIAGVSNIGLDTNWSGHTFAQANWYAFGRLAWNNSMTSEKIADEWIKLTFGQGSSGQPVSTLFSTDWTEQFLLPVRKMMLQSREAAVNYMMPLGLHHIFSVNEHYGPGPWWAPRGIRSDWTPPYYHKADKNGTGFDRIHAGSDVVMLRYGKMPACFIFSNSAANLYLTI